MIGYRYFRTPKNDWRLHHGALIPLNMPHKISRLSYWGSLKLIIRYRVPFVRWDENYDELCASEWWHVIKDSFEDIDGLSANTRSKINRGRKKYTTSIVQRSYIISHGYYVYRSAYSRYSTFEKLIDLNCFKTAVSELPAETEFWAVHDNETGHMVAFSENIVRDNSCFYNTIWFDPRALKSYSSYLLIHEMNKYYLNVCGLAYVSDGSRSINHQSNIHQFLEQKFGFRKAFSRLRIAYFPGLQILIFALLPLESFTCKS